MKRKNSILLRFLIAAALGFGGGNHDGECPGGDSHAHPSPSPSPHANAHALARARDGRSAQCGNPKPTSFDAGPWDCLRHERGERYVPVAGRHFPGDKDRKSGLTNGQVFISKTDGFLQFFVQVGAYSLPDLGLPYLRANNVP